VGVTVRVRPLGKVQVRVPGAGCWRCQPGACFAAWCRRHKGDKLHSQVRPPWSNGCVWSSSQRRAGRRQPGKEQVRLRVLIRCRRAGDGW